ncbi:MAG: serine/threonine-protein kinase [Dehalococcoidia bacterium]
MTEACIVGRPGGSKRTFRAKWNGQVVAVQVLENAAADRLEREIVALQRVSSPFVPRLLKVAELKDREDTLPVFICEFIEGPTLEERVSRGEVYGQAKALKALAFDLARGLQTIHSNNLVHRDFKPGNIIIRENGHAAIVDLGIAKHLDKTTITRLQPGTRGWAAPEQILNQRVDRRADLFCLGLVLHFAAVGAHPFEGGDVNRNIAEGTPNLCLEPSHGTAWQQFVERLLGKQPYERPRGIDVVLRYLEGMP